jgi:hypothetical protein
VPEETAKAFVAPDLGSLCRLTLSPLNHFVAETLVGALRSPSTQLRCHLCGGRREVLALITEGTVVRSILACLGLPADGPVIHPARGPPGLF